MARAPTTRRMPPPGVTFSVVAEQRLLDKLEAAAEFCEYCIDTGSVDVARKAERLLEDLRRG